MAASEYESKMENSEQGLELHTFQKLKIAFQSALSELLYLPGAVAQLAQCLPSLNSGLGSIPSAL